MATTKPKYVLVRTQSAGVFTGYLKSRKGQEVTLTKAWPRQTGHSISTSGNSLGGARGSIGMRNP